jgi:hypothetical protein
LAKYCHKPPDEISEEELRQYLQVGDIDGSRRMLHVRKGKGG